MSVWEVDRCFWTYEWLRDFMSGEKKKLMALACYSVAKSDHGSGGLSGKEQGGLRQKKDPR